MLDNKLIGYHTFDPHKPLHVLLLPGVHPWAMPEVMTNNDNSINMLILPLLTVHLKMPIMDLKYAATSGLNFELTSIS